MYFHGHIMNPRINMPTICFKTRVYLQIAIKITSNKRNIVFLHSTEYPNKELLIV